MLFSSSQKRGLKIIIVGCGKVGRTERYSSTYGYADGISQWDINTRHTVKLRNFTLEPGVGIENIFNQRDTSPWSANFSTINPGRSFIASLRMVY